VTTREERIAALAALPSEAERAVAGLDDTQLDTPYRDGGWTVRQVIHHLADAHVNGYQRMRCTLTEDRPTIKTYEQDAWASLADARQFPLEPSLGVLRGLHSRMVAFFEGLSDKDYARTAVHPEDGEVTLDDLLTIYARHGAHHLTFVTDLRRRKGW
jgi:uncharacterized damage-inducible protein DinB